MYRYACKDGGFEIVNGSHIYNRPLYGPHCRDLESFDERLLAVVGDAPEALLLLLNWRIPGGGGCAAAKLAHFFLGLRHETDAKWFSDCELITARYVPGRQEYHISDGAFGCEVNLTFVRPVRFEGFLVRIRMTGNYSGCRIMAACGGASDYQGGRHYDYQWGRTSAKDFHAEECSGNEVVAEAGRFQIRNPYAAHDKTLSGLVLPFQAGTGEQEGVPAGGFRTADATQWPEPGGLLTPGAGRCGGEPQESTTGGGTTSDRSMACGIFEPSDQGNLWFVLTTESLEDPEIGQFSENPGEGFEEAIKHYTELSRTVRIVTPDPYLNLGFQAQVLAADGYWHDPCFTHGPWSWSSPYAGWRICYGPTVLGWHERVRKSVLELLKDQIKEPEHPKPVWKRPGGYMQGHLCRGAIPDLARNKTFHYNMGEVLVDHILYDWEWTGDLDFMRRVFDQVADKLLWEERCLDADGDGLYENWLNTWISDAHWYNGGGGIQASAYNWRANRLMAETARRLGRDPGVFEERSRRIEQACFRTLWIPEKGIFAEYKEAVGLPRLHEAPELASIYHPIDFGMCDDFQAYQMLRYSEYGLPNDTASVPRGGRLVWSSNWYPVHYSSHGLYPQETINLLLCYYRLGLDEKADALLKGLEASFFNGPCPGGLAHNQRPNGSHFGSTDFSDTTSMFIRTVIEGLFGIRMDVPNNMVTLQPCFPAAWNAASIEGPEISVAYGWDGSRERIEVRTERPLEYRLRIRARSTSVGAVTVDSRPCSHRIKAGIGCAWIVVELPRTRSTVLEIRYDDVSSEPRGIPHLTSSGRAAQDCEYRLTASEGIVSEVHDPQGVLRDISISGRTVCARIAGSPGYHTFFVLIRTGDTCRWLPADVEIRPPVEITRDRLETEGHTPRYTFCLRNNTLDRLKLSGELTIAGDTGYVDAAVPPLGETPPVKAGISTPLNLTPGGNHIRLRLEGDLEIDSNARVTDWHIAGKVMGMAKALEAARTVDLKEHCNRKLAHLHDESYLAPRPGTYSIMVKENGRSIWDWNERGYNLAAPKVDRLKSGTGNFISDIGIPFKISSGNEDCCVVSMWDNHPSEIRIPLGLTGHKLYFLIAASTHPMQSRIENARITCTFESGDERRIPLINPDNLDDWLCIPFARDAYPQYIGEKTHALIVDMDVPLAERIDSVRLQCLSNEVLIALIAITVL